MTFNSHTLTTRSPRQVPAGPWTACNLHKSYRFTKLPRKTQYDEKNFGFLIGGGTYTGRSRSEWRSSGFVISLNVDFGKVCMPIEPRIGESRFMFQTDLNRPVHDMAYAVSITRCGEILEKIAQEFERIGYQPDLPLGLRFLKGTDKVALAMNSGQDVAVIEWASFIEFDDNAKAFRAFERILTEAGGRPHWAKEFSFNPEAHILKRPGKPSPISAGAGDGNLERVVTTPTPAGDAKTAAH